MPAVTLPEIREHLSLTPGVAEEDNAMLERLAAAAQGHVESWLGYTLAARYGSGALPPVPEALRQAILLLVATWFEHRESINATGRPAVVPHGLEAILDAHRDWSFFA